MATIKAPSAKRPRHTSKEVEEAIRNAESLGWVCDYPRIHWGLVFCADAERKGCQNGVKGTPQNPETHARQIRRAVNRCPNQDKEDGDENP